MITRVNHFSIFVLDQDSAYDFYVNKLGFKVHTDASMGPGKRWLTVTPPEQPDLEITLMAIDEGMMFKKDAAEKMRELVKAGTFGFAVFQCNDLLATYEELKARVNELNNGYRGWQLTTGGLLAEQFITGPEFTSFIIGSHTHPNHCIVYEPVERIFHESLPAHEKFLSFDRLWEIYEDETPMPGNGNFYNYSAVDISLAESLKQISLDAYCAVGGTGYARIDIRMDATTGRLYLLEVNAQCGLSEDEDYTSIGAILRFTGKTYTQLVAEVLQDALTRRGNSN